MLGLGFALTNFGTKGGVVDTPDLSGSSATAALRVGSGVPNHFRATSALGDRSGLGWRLVFGVKTCEKR